MTDILLSRAGFRHHVRNIASPTQTSSSYQFAFALTKWFWFSSQNAWRCLDMFGSFHFHSHETFVYSPSRPSQRYWALVCCSTREFSHRRHTALAYGYLSTDDALSSWLCVVCGSWPKQINELMSANFQRLCRPANSHHRCGMHLPAAAIAVRLMHHRYSTGSENSAGGVTHSLRVPTNNQRQCQTFKRTK